MAQLIGKQIGNYIIYALIGQGGHGTVYRCEHIFHRTEYAIKVVLKPLSTEHEKLFLNEIELHSLMNHPAIVPFHESGETTDCCYLVMDYASLGTLERLSGQQVEISIIVPYVKQIAAALDYVHRQQVIHCDVKPANFLLMSNGVVLLSDFGIAVKTSHIVKDLYGTVEYVAPERWKRKPCPASDQYSLAITVYEWLSGEYPFDNEKDILLKAPPSLRRKLPLLTQEVEDVVFKALEKQPQYRYADVTGFATALEQAYTLTMPTLSTSTPAMPSPATISKKTRKIGQPVIVQLNQSGKTRKLASGSGITLTGKERSLYAYSGHNAEVIALAWSPDGKQLVSADLNNVIHIWNAIDGTNVSTHKGFSRMILNVAWSPDGLNIASADEVQAVQFWDVATGKTLFRYHHRTGPLDEIGIGLYYPMIWSRDGFFMISASDNQPLEKWDTATGNRLLKYTQHGGAVKALAWSPDERLVASGGADTQVHVWDASTGNTIFVYRKHRGYIYALAWSANSQRVASAGADGIVHVWNAVDGSNPLIYNGHRSREVNSLAWSPDGSTIASADDKRVRIWNALRGDTLTTLEEHTDKINVIAWSPTGEHIASASDDGTVRMWKIEV